MAVNEDAFRASGPHHAGVSFHDDEAAVIHSSLGGKKQGTKVMGCVWRLPQLLPTDLAKLRTSPLVDTDLNDWNSLVGIRDAKTMFADGILSLKSILDTAETII
jgi:hypothetical protein